jgi:coniferyl-aldehyde dehydrogenase
MNANTRESRQALAAVERVQRLFAAQRAACLAQPCPSLAERRKRLLELKRQAQRYQDLLAAAMSSDFGFRPAAESKMLDLLGSVLEANHALSHLKRWMRPSKRSTELLFLGNSIKVSYQPKGVVGVIVPWNFPIYLALGPLVTALAAGNRVMIKMSELTPATNKVLRQLLAEIFDEDLVAVVGEELVDPNVFTSLPFNHIVFTGSPGVGKIVMRTAAQNLTPVTLELGGKSPAVVTRSYPVADAALRITHGKSTNCGQICIAPDYAMVPRESVDAFVAGVQASFQRFYAGHTDGNPNFTSVINDRHFQRLNAAIDDARAKGATVIACAPQPKGGNRQLPLHIVVGATPEMTVMQEELFGPVLPVLAYDQLDDAIDFINRRERPLALYCFSTDSAERDRLLERTHSGGVSINDWGWHAINHDAPFGGIGNSGMGNYHGEEGFRELSHSKTVFQRRRWFPTQLFHPPYGTKLQQLAVKFFLKHADPALARNVSPMACG